MVTSNRIRRRFDVRSLHNRLETAGSRIGPGIFLGVRLLIGFECVRSGLKHLINFDGAAAYFAKLQIPAPESALVVSALAELTGGLLLMVGLGTRAACIPLFINFLVAYLTSGRESLVLLLTLQDAWKFVTYPAFPFLLASMWFFVTGAGRMSLDHLILRTGDRAME